MLKCYQNRLSNQTLINQRWNGCILNTLNNSPANLFNANYMQNLNTSYYLVVLVLTKEIIYPLLFEFNSFEDREARSITLLHKQITKNKKR
jgi:hypothetical protein